MCAVKNYDWLSGELLKKGICSKIMRLVISVTIFIYVNGVWIVSCNYAMATNAFGIKNKIVIESDKQLDVNKTNYPIIA